MTGIILAGGKNTRMGTNKAFLTVEGERLIDRTVRIFKELFREVILVTNEPLNYLDLDLTIATDIYKGKGALGGIYTGLFFAQSEQAFVAACDMPFLNKGFIEHLIKKAAAYDVVVPSTPEGFQPLHAVYSKRCLVPIKQAMERGNLKITGFYKGLKVYTLLPEDIASFPPQEKLFFNINSPQDVELSKKNVIR
jgi:molybdenum cofactor guanylyltransferase